MAISQQELLDAVNGMGGQYRQLESKIFSRLDVQGEEIRKFGAASDKTATAMDAFNEDWKTQQREAADLNRELLTRVVGMLEGKGELSPEQAAIVAAAGTIMPRGGMQLHDMLTESNQFAQYMERGFCGNSPEIPMIGHRPFERRSVPRSLRETKFHNDTELAGGDFGMNWMPLTDIPLREDRISDIIPFTPTQNDTIRYIEETIQDVFFADTSVITAAIDLTVTFADTVEGFYPGQTGTITDGTNSKALTVAADGVNYDTRVVTFTAAVDFIFAVGSKFTSGTFAPTARANVNPFAKLTLATKTQAIKDFFLMMAIPNNYLQDIPMLSTFLQQRLPLFVGQAKDQQMLYGDPAANDREIQGMTTATGITTFSMSAGEAGDTEIDALRRCATLVALQFYLAEAFIIHPTDFAKIETKKAGDGKYLFAGAPFSDTIRRIWRMVPVETSAITVGTSLVGAFSVAVMGWDRMKAAVRFLDQHSDYAARNMIAVQVIERLALTVLRPQGLALCTFDSEP